MNRIKFFKKLMMPCGLCATIPVARPNDENKCTNVNNISSNNNNVVNTIDIHPYYRPAAQRTLIDDTEPSQFEENIANIRRSIQEKIKTVLDYKNSVTDKIDTGIAHTKATLDYLKEESNILPRIGAVGVGGISGYILALRGGKLKKFVYSSTGALAIASISYPKKANEGFSLMKYYACVGYNFVTGVKPGQQSKLEKPTLLDLKEISFSRISDYSLDTISSLFNKIIQAYQDFAATPTPPGEKKVKDA